jgi:hypothetical protein
MLSGGCSQKLDELRVQASDFQSHDWFINPTSLVRPATLNLSIKASTSTRMTCLEVINYSFDLQLWPFSH